MKYILKLKFENKLSKIFFCFLVISLFSINTFAQEEWYMIFGAGDPPKRAAFFVDMNSISQQNGVASINFVNVFEEAGNPQYTSSLMEFRCNKNEWRIASGENYTFENTTVPFKDSPWSKISNPLFERVKKFACNQSKFAQIRQLSIDNSGKVNDQMLNTELEKAGLEGGMLLMTSSIIPNFDTVLEILWTKFWKTNRPKRTGIAKNIDKKPNSNSPKPSGTAEGFVKTAAEFIRIGNYDKALTDLAKAIQISPNYSPAYFYRGYIFADVGEFDLAITNYTKALEYNPNDTSSYLNRGIIYYEQKHKFDLAEADFTKLIQLDPQNAQAFAIRGDVYESWGKDNLADADRKKFQSLGGNLLPGLQNRRRMLFPMAEFNTDLALSALQQGTSTLIGRACAYVKNGLWGMGGTDRFDASNVRVALFPVTPYLEKWYQLREKKEDKKTGVFINREAQKYVMISQTNAKGEFVFSRLKPGKYFIQIIFNFTQVKSKRIYTGSDTSQNGPVITTTNYYEDRDFFIDRSNRLESFVEIKSDGESKKVTVKNKKLALFGCKDLP